MTTCDQKSSALQARIVNIAAYKFMALTDDELPQLRHALKAVAADHHLLGTILLSQEGINLFLAGPGSQVEGFWRFLTSRPKFAELDKKISYSAEQPFKHLYVKIKSEIINMGLPGIEPNEAGEQRIPPAELKKWFDEQREFTLLDTRNDYEVNIGTFENARHLNIQSFRDFPQAVTEQLGEELRAKPLVMFCTGGIRCEKAASFLQQQGFQDVYQLDGGILRYLEKVGSSHFDGECFVFDQRVALGGDLQPSGAVLCRNCQMPLTVAQQSAANAIPGTPCPYCRQAASRPST